MRRPPVRLGLLPLAFAVCCLAAGVGRLSAEPRAELRLDWAWQAADDKAATAAGGELLLGIAHERRVYDATLTVTAPLAVEVRVLTAPWSERATAVPSADGTQAFRLDLGDLEPGLAPRLRFRLHAPPGEGGVVSFSLRGRGPDGKPSGGAAGVPVGRRGQSGRLRDGVREFEGSSLPAGDR